MMHHDSLLEHQPARPSLWRSAHLERQYASLRDLIMSDDGLIHVTIVYAQ